GQFCIRDCVRGPGVGVVGNRAGSVGAARDRTPDEGTADGSPPRGGSVTTEPSRPGGSPPDDPTPGNSAPGDRTPGGTTPDDPTSGGPTPDDATPDGPTPGGRVTTGPSRPGDSTPDNPTPGNSAPGGPTPDDTAPDGPTPGGSTADDEGRDDRAVGADGPVLGADGTPVWPGVPDAVEGALKGSFLVPYSFRQLDSFAGYESGMPSPGYYQRVWDEGVGAAADGLVRAVVSRLRARNHPVSTADLIAARALTQGLTALRDHPRPARTDVLDGMAGALIGEDLDQPLPWTTRGTLTAGAHPVVVEMIAASGGDRVGTLHPDTPRPPLVADVAGRLAALGLTGDGPFTLDLTRPGDLERSRVLHRLRVLGVPGHERTEGPRGGADPRFDERWETRPAPARDAALIEAGAYGASLDEAAEAVLTERARGLTGVPGGATARPGGPGSAPASPPGVDHGPDADGLARTLFDVVLCGVERLSEPLLGALAGRVRGLREAGPLGDVLATALGLWRHDRVFGTARSPLLVSVLDGAVERLLWLFEGAHTPGTTAPRPASAPRPGGPGVDLARLAAVAAVRDTLWHASGVLSVTRETVTAVACRVSGDDAAPPDLRGAAFGLHRCLTGTHDPAAVGATVRALPGVSVLGDWLAGLFAVARDELTTDQGSGGDGPKPLIGVVDGMIGAMSDEEFLIGLPALRQAFAFFPPRERERIAERLLERRGVRGSARSLLRTTADPVLLARAAALEDDVSRQLDRYGLGTAP
uniref:DUF5682 family protein n=1 Tax=Streptomyces brasiliscabiei TaxID=2736302 RepID=UPI001C114990